MTEPKKRRIFTATGSIHEIDYQSGTYVRLIGGFSTLRRDGEFVPLVRATRPVVGEPMIMLLRVREDGVLTTRMTSAVTRIEERD